MGKLTQAQLNEILELWSEDHVLGIESLFNVRITDQQKQLVRLADNQKARVAVASCTGSGKALCNYERIHTPSGLIEMGDIREGDIICNSYGSTSKVTAVYPQGIKDCYRVYFNNNTHVDCDLDHLWTVSSYHSHADFTTISLREILKRGYVVKTKETKRNPKGIRLKYYLPSISPLSKDDNHLIVDPYVLGVWLGDGGRGTSRITNIDQEVWDQLEDRGYKLSEYQGQTKTVYGLITKLKELGISNSYSYEKYVPEAYKTSSRRLEVLQGLMDTDGTISKKGDCTYYSTSYRLASDVQDIVRSLGGSSRDIKVKKTTHRDCYVVHFQFPEDLRLFNIERKEKRRVKGKINSSRVYIKDIEYIGKHEATCITVDSEDSLFVCENYIPTHNTATLSMLTFLYLMILPDCRIIITSPSFQQLNRVFSAELRKWYRKMPEQFQEFFEITRDTVRYTNTSKYEQFASLVTASVENKESLQGGHAENYVIFADEASGISEEAFDILLGTLSTGHGGRFIQVSNPVRSSGRFYQIFKEEMSSWNAIHFSAYDSPNVNDEWIQEMADTYGEDSDLFRMRVLGRFPRVGVSQFISADIVEDAVRNNLELTAFSNFSKIMGVDVARFGDDTTAFVVRQGPKLLDIRTFKGLDTMEVASKVAEFQAIHQCATIFVDSIGIGAGTYDRCKQLGLPVKEVVVSSKSSQPNIYCNLRTQVWGTMRDWLNNGADLPYSSKDKDANLAAQLTSMEYTYNNKMQLQLLSKRDLKRQGHESPDIADALSLTFADTVYTNNSRNQQKKPIRRVKRMWV